MPCGLQPPPSKFYSRHKTAGAAFPIGLGRLGERRFGDKIQNYGGAEAFIGLTGPFYGSREEWRIFTTYSGATKGRSGPPSAQFDVRTRDERNFCCKVEIFKRPELELGLTSEDIGAMADARVCRDWRSVAVIVLREIEMKLRCLMEFKALPTLSKCIYGGKNVFSYLEMYKFNVRLFLNLN